MKRTHVTPIVGIILVGAVLGYIGELAMQSLGAHLLLPPYSLSVTVVAIALAVVGLAIPVRRRVTGKRKQPLSPFYAVRVAVLAKSSTLVGSMLLGAGAGITVFILTLPTTLDGSLVAPGIVLVVGSAILLAAGLIAEFLCTLPPDDEDKETLGDTASRA